MQSALHAEAWAVPLVCSGKGETGLEKSGWESLSGHHRG